MKCKPVDREAERKAKCRNCHGTFKTFTAFFHVLTTKICDNRSIEEIPSSQNRKEETIW
jgi:hypothetical protein